jgi:uncharacterized protein (DUF58 family)
MLPQKLKSHIRRIEITTRKAVNTLLAGGYHSVFKGRGMEFEEVRAYQPGDDVRFIDWNVSARLGGAWVKRFREERELTVWLLVDMSASERFATTGSLKSEMAAELAALIAFSAIKNNDRVGVVLFTDRVEKFIPPKKGKKHVLRVIADILSYKPEHQGTDLGAALEFVSRVGKRQAVVFLLSDFFSEQFTNQLRVAASRHDLIPIVLSDRRERELPDVGLLPLLSNESEEMIFIDTSNKRVRDEYKKKNEERIAELTQSFKRLSLDYDLIDTGQDYVGALVRLFQRRARRLAA